MTFYHEFANIASHNEEGIQNGLDTLMRFDSYIGEVIGYAPCGLLILLENGIECFAFGNGKKGDIALVSIQRIDHERNRVRCSIDSFYHMLQHNKEVHMGYQQPRPP